MKSAIVTYTGKSFDLLNPTPDMVCIEDIAHSLAYQCRYTGHTQEFYSVAQHCVLMAMGNLPGDPLVRLLHDSAEAYIGDIARPWKQLLFVKNPNIGAFHPYWPVGEVEQGILDVIGVTLGVDIKLSAEVKESDNRMLATETRDLMPSSNIFCLEGIEPMDSTIVPMSPELAEASFLRIYFNLLKERKNT